MSRVFKAICNSTLLPLEAVKDPVFSQKMLGDGVAFYPESSTLYAPVTSTITMIYPTKHAIGMTAADNVEVLVHIGLESYQIDSDVIQVKVQVGDKVNAGDILAEVNFDYFKQHDIDMTIPVVITSGQKITVLKPHQQVVALDNQIISWLDEQ